MVYPKSELDYKESDTITKSYQNFNTHWYGCVPPPNCAQRSQSCHGFEVIMGKFKTFTTTWKHENIVTSTGNKPWVLLLQTAQMQETRNWWLLVSNRWQYKDVIFFSLVRFMNLLISTYKALRLGWEEAPGILGWEVLVSACIQMWEARQLGRNKVLKSTEQSTIRTAWKGDYSSTGPREVQVSKRWQ